MGNGWSKYTTENNTALTGIYNFMQCLTLAYNERSNNGIIPIGWTMPDINRFCKIYDPYRDGYVVPVGYVNILGFCNQLDIYIDNSVAAFGRYDGAVFKSFWYNDSFYPSSINIYTDIGETRIDSRHFSKITVFPQKEWFTQVIKILNKLTVLIDMNHTDISGDLEFVAGS